MGALIGNDGPVLLVGDFNPEAFAPAGATAAGGDAPSSDAHDVTTGRSAPCLATALFWHDPDQPMHCDQPEGHPGRHTDEAYNTEWDDDVQMLKPARDIALSCASCGSPDVVPIAPIPGGGVIGNLYASACSTCGWASRRSP